MLPVLHIPRTAKQIVWYTVILVAATMLPVAFGVFGLVYGVAALALGALLLWMSVQLWRRTTRPQAARVFHYSMLYLALLFVAMAVDVTI
jgi:protoheme IX farnesyltransferase